MKMLCIDPGAGGAIAYVSTDGNVDAEAMPEGMTAICDRIQDYAEAGYDKVIIERVGGYRPGNSGPAAAKFARHCGWLDVALYTNKIALYKNPTPQQWMKLMGVPKFEKVQDRKRWIKEWVQKRLPKIRVTLTTADALGMLIVLTPDE